MTLAFLSAMLYGVELQEGLIIIDDYDKVSKIDKRIPIDVSSPVELL